MNKPDKDKDQVLASGMDKDKYKRVREDMSLSRSPISKLERLQQKLKVPREKISEAKN